jgi:hypothetical protein
LDLSKPLKIPVKLTVTGQPALLTPNASTEKPLASLGSNGSRSGTFQLIPLIGIQQKITPKERLKLELKERTMLSGQYYSATSPTTICCSRQATSSIGLSLLELW